MKRLIFVYLPAFLIVLVTTQVFAQKVDFQPKMDSLFGGLDTHSKFMGTVAIIDNGAIAYSRAVGLANVEMGVKATTLTKYRIGSITKMFTSVMIYRFTSLSCPMLEILI